MSRSKQLILAVSGVGSKPAKGSAAPGARMCMLLGEGMRQSCSHLCATLATTPADVRNRAGCGVAQCITPRLYLDLDAGRSLVLTGDLGQEGAGRSKCSWFLITHAEPSLARDE